jgi:Tol biopolymer transport system component
VDSATKQPIAFDIGSIILSADGTRATFDLYGGLGDTSSNQWDIWVANADGTGNPLPISNDTYEDFLPQFSPNGTKVVYASYRPVPGDLPTYQWQIVVATSDGSGTAQVLPIPEGVLYQTHPTYSPDGAKLVMMAAGYMNGVAFDGILLTNADGTNAQLLSNPLYSEGCYYCVDELPSFTPDGQSIVFSRDNWNGSEFEDIYIMNVDGSNPTQLTDSVGINHDPLVLNVSGVGQRIVFSSNRDNLTVGTGGFDLYSAKLDGTGITRLTSNTLYDAFSEWWYGDAVAAAARHSNPVSREHTLHRGHASSGKVHW